MTLTRVDKADLDKVRALLRDEQAPVLAHRAWIEPSLRSWFPQAARPSAYARPTAQDLPVFWTIGHRSDPDSITFAPDAQLVTTRTHGALVARKWEQPMAPHTLASLGQSPLVIKDLQARVAQGRCKIRSRVPLEIQCPDQSSLSWQRSEIGYKPRTCLRYKSSQLGPLTLSFKLAQAAQRVRGHVGFNDFNARLRSDAALQVILESQGQVLINQPFSDAQGWAPLEAALDPDPANPTPTFQLTLLFNAQDARSPRLRRRVQPCIELRFQRLEPTSQ